MEFARVLESNLLLNYQVYSGYTFRSPTKKNVEFGPSVYYQMFTSAKRPSTDLNFKYRKFKKNEDYFWTGISYRFLND
jgi:hypothetical protein